MAQNPIHVCFYSNKCQWSKAFITEISATPWKAHTDVADCFGPSLPGLEIYRPRLLYHLVDEARLKLHPRSEVRNLAEALFRLERSRTPPDMVRTSGLPSKSNSPWH